MLSSEGCGLSVRTFVGELHCFWTRQLNVHMPILKKGYSEDLIVYEHYRFCSRNGLTISQEVCNTFIRDHSSEGTLTISMSYIKILKAENNKTLHAM